MDLRLDFYQLYLLDQMRIVCDFKELLELII